MSVVAITITKNINLSIDTATFLLSKKIGQVTFIKKEINLIMLITIQSLSCFKKTIV